MATDGIKLIQQVDAGIHRDTAEQDEGSKPTLVEVQFEEPEGEEHPDVRDGNYKDDGQWLSERVEQDGGEEENDGHDHEQQAVLAVVLLRPFP